MKYSEEYMHCDKCEATYSKGEHHISKRIQKLMKAAIEVAKKSEMPQFRHGAILFNYGSVMSIGVNDGGYSSFGARFQTIDQHIATHHAEIKCILRQPKSVTRGAIIVVARVNNNNEVRFSKPCEMCQQIAKFTGVKKIYYSVDENAIGIVRL